MCRALALADDSVCFYNVAENTWEHLTLRHQFQREIRDVQVCFGVCLLLFVLCGCLLCCMCVVCSGIQSVGTCWQWRVSLVLDCGHLPPLRLSLVCLLFVVAVLSVCWFVNSCFGCCLLCRRRTAARECASCSMDELAAGVGTRTGVFVYSVVCVFVVCSFQLLVHCVVVCVG